MRKRINYKHLCKKAIKIIKEVRNLCLHLAELELSEPVRLEVEDILNQINSLNIDNLKEQGIDKGYYSQCMEVLCQIEDNLSEVEMVTGDMITEVNKLPEDIRKKWYDEVGIEEISPEFEGMSEELKDKIDWLLGRVNEVQDESSIYYDIKKEDYVDYEDEIKED